MVQPGIMSNSLLDFDRIEALANVSIEAMTSGLGLASDLQVRLVIQVEDSTNQSRVCLLYTSDAADD